MATNSRHSHTGQTYCGLPCDSRRVITAEPAHHNRVESPPRNSEPNLRDMVYSSGGHVCHNPQHASSPVYVSSSGALSTGGRCSVTRLAGEVDVHVSTVSEAQDHSGKRSDINSPLVAITTMVSTSTSSSSSILLTENTINHTSTCIYYSANNLSNQFKEITRTHLYDFIQNNTSLSK